MGRAELRGDFKIAAHAHRERLEAVSGGDFRKEGEMRRRRLISRRNAHESVDFEPEFGAAPPDKGIRFLRRDACLLQLLAGIDLDEEAHPAALLEHFFRDRLGDLRPVDGFNDVKQGDGFGRLVGLQGTNQAEFDFRVRRFQRRPFRLCLLDPVLAEHAVAGVESFAKLSLALLLRYRDNLDRGRTACFLQRGLKSGADRGEIGGEAGGMDMIGIGVHDGLRTRAAKLAAAAAGLKRQSRAAATPFSLAFLTDRWRVSNPEPIIRAMPAGAAVIYRDYDDPRRRAVARRLAVICRLREVLFLVGGDCALAREIGADGVHWPARMLPGARKGCGLIVTAACHNAAELKLADAAGAQAALLSPAFATGSHPNADGLGVALFRALAAHSPLPVLALGGVDATNAQLLAGPNVAGFAAISAFKA